MKTVEQLYKESIKKINVVSVITEVTKHIKKITDALEKTELKNWNADELSRALTTLAVLRVNLGAEMANAIAYYDFSYLRRKITYVSSWKPTKDKLNKILQRATIQDIDSTIQEKMADDYVAELEHKHYAEQLKVLYSSTETLITALQSRLGVLKQERAEARHG